MAKIAFNTECSKVYLIGGARDQKSKQTINDMHMISFGANGIQKQGFGDLDIPYYHRIAALWKKNGLRATDLKDYRQNIDYFISSDDYLKFIHGQFHAHGKSIVELSWRARYPFTEDQHYVQKKRIPYFMKDTSKWSTIDSINAADDDGLNIKYLPYIPGEPADIPEYGLADHLGEQHDAGSPAAKFVGKIVSAAKDFIWGQ